MNYRKAILGLSIALGVFVGGYLSWVNSGFLFGGVMVGGLLGGLVYCLINWVVSRRIHKVLPYDSLDGHHQINNSGNTQTPEARVRGMQDGLMDNFMLFKPKR